MSHGDKFQELDVMHASLRMQAGAGCQTVSVECLASLVTPQWKCHAMRQHVTPSFQRGGTDLVSDPRSQIGGLVRSQVILSQCTSQS